MKTKTKKPALKSRDLKDGEELRFVRWDGARIIARHVWKTGYQTLVFNNLEHFNTFRA